MDLVCPDRKNTVSVCRRFSSTLAPIGQQFDLDSEHFRASCVVVYVIMR